MRPNISGFSAITASDAEPTGPSAIAGADGREAGRQADADQRQTLAQRDFLAQPAAGSAASTSCTPSSSSRRDPVRKQKIGEHAAFQPARHGRRRGFSSSQMPAAIVAATEKPINAINQFIIFS